MDEYTSLLIRQLCNACKYFCVYRGDEPCKSCRTTNYEPVIKNIDKIPMHKLEDMLEEPEIRNCRLAIREKMIEVNKGR